jgi:chemotaxis protein CheD
MYEIFDVNTGQVVVKKGQITLRAIAIGSCIAVAVYDPKTNNAGIAHIMLPGQAPQGCCEKTKYACDGIEYLLNQLIESGSVLGDISVCLVGAGNVLRKEDDTVCPNNIQSVTTILAKKAIPVRMSILGGCDRKSVFLDAKNGRISYSQGDSSVKLLWQPTDQANVCRQSLANVPQQDSVKSDHR